MCLGMVSVGMVPGQRADDALCPYGGLQLREQRRAALLANDAIELMPQVRVPCFGIAELLLRRGHLLPRRRHLSCRVGLGLRDGCGGARGNVLGLLGGGRKDCRLLTARTRQLGA